MSKFSKKLVLATAISLVALAPLHAMAANKLIVNDTTANPAFVVSDQGFVGIGTTSPVKPVDVSGTAVINTQIRSRLSFDTNLGGGGVIVYHNRATSGGTYNNLLARNGDRLGYYYFGSLSVTPDPTSNGQPYGLNAAGIAAYADADFNLTADQNNLNAQRIMPSHFSFETASSLSGNARVERLRIGSEAAAGTTQVAINTGAPQATLDVNGSFRINPGNTLPAGGAAVTKPACTDTNRGTFWFTPGGGTGLSAPKDLLEICATDGSTGAHWRQLY